MLRKANFHIFIEVMLLSLPTSAGSVFLELRCDFYLHF